MCTVGHAWFAEGKPERTSMGHAQEPPNQSDENMLRHMAQLARTCAWRCQTFVSPPSSSGEAQLSTHFYCCSPPSQCAAVCIEKEQ